MIAYSLDYDERFPNWEWGRDRGNPPVSGNPASPLPWYLAIFPYVKNQQVYVCPSDTRCPDGGETGRMCCSDCKYERWAYSYGYNEPISANCCNFNRVANILKPASTLLLADARTSLTGWDPAGYLVRIIFADWNARGNAMPNCCAPPNTAAMTDATGPRHLGGCNVAFVDGHVKWIYWERLRTPGDRNNPVPGAGIILRKWHEDFVP